MTNTKIYKSIKDCSRETGIPQLILKIAKHHPDSVGFKTDGRIDWAIAEPFIKSHYDELSNDDIQKWKLRKLQSETRQEEMKEATLKGKTLDKEETASQIHSIATAQKNILRSKLCDELPPRLLGLGVTEMTVEMQKVLQEICSLMQNLKI